MSAQDRRAILRILVGMKNLSNAPVNDRINKLNEQLRVAINLTRTITHALRNTTTAGTQVQLKLLSEIKVLLRFGKKRATWFYSRLSALYSALETYKSRQNQVDRTLLHYTVPGYTYQVAARVGIALLWIRKVIEELDRILNAVLEDTVDITLALPRGLTMHIHSIKSILLGLLKEANSKYPTLSRHQGTANCHQSRR